MKRALFALFTFALLACSYASPALANGTAHSNNLTVTIANLPESCPAGETMIGKMTVSLGGSTINNAPVRPQVVTLTMSVETPFGDVNLGQRSVRVTPGANGSVKFPITVPENTPAGVYTFNFDVTSGRDEVSIDHRVTVY